VNSGQEATIFSATVESQQKEKKRKFFSYVLKDVVTSPLLSSQWLDEMLGREARTFDKRLTATLANKWEMSYSEKA
jgi:hypothetical protein